MNGLGSGCATRGSIAWRMASRRDFAASMTACSHTKPPAAWLVGELDRAAAAAEGGKALQQYGSRDEPAEADGDRERACGRDRAGDRSAVRRGGQRTDGSQATGERNGVRQRLHPAGPEP